MDLSKGLRGNMTKSIIIYNAAELQKYRNIIQSNLDKSNMQLQELMKAKTSLEIFQYFKFEKCVTEPLSGKQENLIEVINQSMTYLISVKAVEYLFNIYTNQTFIVNWGNASGYDIESEDGTVIGECFAATSFRSNGKLAADLKKLYKNKTARYKYEFFYDKEFTDRQKIYYENKYPEIRIIKFKGMS